MNEEKPKRPRSSAAGGERPLRRPRAEAKPGDVKKPSERFPTERKHSVDKKSLQNQNAGANSDRKGLSTFSEFALAPRKKLAAKPAPARGKAQEITQEKTRLGERVAKVMARAGACSRRDAEQWIAEGRVAVNGRKLESPAFNVREGDQITVDGAPLAERERTRLFLFHKPAGLVTSAKDPEGRETVFAYLAERHPELPRLVSIGRLDINTEGLLLLSNDGSLARVLELPATGWTRRYRVRAHGAIDQAMLDGLAQGVTVDETTYAPIEARLDRIQGANAWITMALTEGKNREIKRVLEHLGLDVNRLIRISFGPFQLGDLAEGAVEEVRLKTLREQLGKGLAELAGVDFSSPLRETPTAADQQQARIAAQNRPRKHVSALRKSRDAEEQKPRARIERAVTADRKGRAVAVERVVVKNAAEVPHSRNARRFESLRRGDEGRDERAPTKEPARAPRKGASSREEFRPRREDRTRDEERPRSARGQTTRSAGARPPRAEKPAGRGEGRSYAERKPRDAGDRPPRRDEAPGGARSRRSDDRPRAARGGDGAPRAERSGAPKRGGEGFRGKSFAGKSFAGKSFAGKSFGGKSSAGKSSAGKSSGGAKSSAPRKPAGPRKPTGSKGPPRGRR